MFPKVRGRRGSPQTPTFYLPIFLLILELWPPERAGGPLVWNLEFRVRGLGCGAGSPTNRLCYLASVSISFPVKCVSFSETTTSRFSESLTVRWDVKAQVAYKVTYKHWFSWQLFPSDVAQGTCGRPAVPSMGLKSQCDTVDDGLLACTLASYPLYKLHHGLCSKEATLFPFNINSFLQLLSSHSKAPRLLYCLTQVTVDLSSAATRVNFPGCFPRLAVGGVHLALACPEELGSGTEHRVWSAQV